MMEEFERVFKKFLPSTALVNKLESRLKYGTEVLPNLKNKINLVDTNQPVFPGIRMLPAFGHRSDHYAVEIESDGSNLLHIVDAFRHPIQIQHPDWYSFIDSYPDKTVETIKYLLNRAREKKAQFFGAHFEFPGLLRLE